MKRRTRRDTESFSRSFLDCICCGFGAIILLLVLNEFGEPIQLEQAKVDLDATPHFTQGCARVINSLKYGNVIILHPGLRPGV